MLKQRARRNEGEREKGEANFLRGPERNYSWQMGKKAI